MRASIRFCAALALLSLPLAAFQAGQKASLEGRVVNAVTSDPVRKVSLSLAPTKGKGKPATAITDENGRFAFKDVEPGGYRLSGERNGFLRQEYGARLNPTSGAVLGLESGRSITDLTFRLAPNAVISGRVVDQEGEPMPNLVISATKKGYSRGKVQWLPAGGAQTNDRGEYRISGLRAGSYRVSATSLNAGIDVVGMSKSSFPDKPEQGYTTTELSAPVEVRAGEDRRGTDVQMSRTATVRIRGKVVGKPEGKMLMLTLMRKGADAAATPAGIGVVQQNDSSFEVKGLTPGSYLVLARSLMDGMGAVGAPTAVDVGEQHIDGLEIRLGEAGELTGSVTLAGAPATAAIRLERVDFPMPDAPNTRSGEDGRFTLRSIPPGKYQVEVSDLPENAFVKSVRVAGQAVPDEGVDLNSGTAKLEVELSPAGATVDGVVSGPEDKPLPGATIALLPVSGRQALYRSTTSDHDGTFTLKGIAPGQYKVLAWEDLEPGAWRDPEFVKPFEAGAKLLAVEENGRSKLALKANVVKDR